MNILAIGDVVGSVGGRFLRAHLPALKKWKSVDMVIANGENSADGNGITPASAEYLFQSGVDVITTGNHTFRRREAYPMFDSCETLLRPANCHASAPGRGVLVYDMGRVQVGVVNLLGVVYMDYAGNPFDTADRLLGQGLPKITLVDMHAEATGEKKSLAYYLDGRVSALFGTHTHVQTADECVLPGGTGYISDLGMTGPIHSVLGVKPQLTIERMRTHMPVRFDLAGAPCQMDCALFAMYEKTGKKISVERIQVK